MAKELQFLRLQDDLEQAAKEITHLSILNETLLSSQGTCNGELSRLNIENNALKLERDELRNIIQVADSGIADISDHWKQKFFSWRETESTLRKELTENRTQIHELITERKEAEARFEQRCAKLKQENGSLAEKIAELSDRLTSKDAEIEQANSRLVEESKKSLQLMFVGRENDLLQEKLRVLEGKVESFYEDSAARQTCPQVEPEREGWRGVEQENRRLRSELSQASSNVRHLQEELSRTTCLNETQASKINLLRRQSETSDQSLAGTAQNLQKEREKCKKANASLTDLHNQLTTLTKINGDLKNELALKARLISEKDAQIQNYKSSYQTLEERVGKNISDMDQYRTTLDTREKENMVLVQRLEELKDKHASLIKRSHGLEEENRALARDNEECNVQIQSLSNRYREAELASTAADRALGQWQQRALDLEIDLNEKVLQIEETAGEKERLGAELGGARAEVGRLSDVVLEKAALVRQLQSELVTERAERAKEVEQLRLEMVQVESVSSAVSSVQPSLVLVDVGTLTDPVPEKKGAKEREEELKERVRALEGDCEMGRRKLAHAQAELQKQTSRLIGSECRIEQLQVKLSAAAAAPAPRSRHSSRHSSRRRSSSASGEQLRALQAEISALQAGIAEREVELGALRGTEEKLVAQNRAYGELAGLVEGLQSELVGSHSATLRELNFYKERLMRYEQGLGSGVSKETNTSPHLSSSGPGQVAPPSPGPPPVDLSELVTVMDNLKCEYLAGLDRICAGEVLERGSPAAGCVV